MTLEELIKTIVSDAEYFELISISFDSVYDAIMEDFGYDFDEDPGFDQEKSDTIRKFYKDRLYHGLK